MSGPVLVWAVLVDVGSDRRPGRDRTLDIDPDVVVAGQHGVLVVAVDVRRQVHVQVDAVGVVNVVAVDHDIGQRQVRRLVKALVLVNVEVGAVHGRVDDEVAGDAEGAIERDDARGRVDPVAHARGHVRDDGVLTAHVPEGLAGVEVLTDGKLRTRVDFFRPRRRSRESASQRRSQNETIDHLHVHPAFLSVCLG